MRQQRLYTLVGLFVGGAISLIILIALYAYDEYLREKVETYVMFFKGSLTGIHVGSEVTYRGVKIGEVKRIEVTENQNKNKIKIPVYVQFFVERSFIGKQSPIQLLIKKGFVASITKPNFLTGVASIDLVYSSPAFRAITSYHGYPLYPTKSLPEEYTTLDDTFKAAKVAFENISNFVHSQQVNGAFDSTKKMADSMDRLVKHLHDLIPPTLKQFNLSLKDVSALTTNLNELTPPVLKAFDHSLKQVSNLVKDTDAIVPLMFNTFNKSMQDVSNAAVTAENFMSYLSRYPESLLRGKR